MAKRSKPKIVIIAGPNGAGKTTFAKEFLTHEADCSDFINADIIAEKISPSAPSKAALAAGKIMLKMIREKIKKRSSFAFESTLAGLSYARHIPKWRRRGYYVKIVFLSLPSARMAIARVKARVLAGGHHVPPSVVRRRFTAGLNNFHRIYCDLADAWMLYDNSGPTPRMIAAKDVQ
jgi:predicted ABC-type ATPase